MEVAVVEVVDLVGVLFVDGWAGEERWDIILVGKR